MKSTMRNMVLSLTAIAATMGAVLGGVHYLTAQPIAEAAIKAKTEALSSVLPAFDNNPDESSTEVTVDSDTRPVTVYTATLKGETVGYAVESWTMDGFSGEITVMVGFDADGVLTGYRILHHNETPGLGAKADKWFNDTVGNRSVIGTSADLSVSKDGGQIDGITAATITSRAFLDAVNRARQALPKQPGDKI